jgi:hypothetical protein
MWDANCGLLDRFLDRALCFATEGYEQHSQLQD